MGTKAQCSSSYQNTAATSGMQWTRQGRQSNQLVNPNEKGCRASVEHLDRLMMWH